MKNTKSAKSAKMIALMQRVINQNVQKFSPFGNHPAWMMDTATVQIKFACVCCGKEATANTLSKHRNIPTH
jgi:hypothetical protein